MKFAFSLLFKKTFILLFMFGIGHSLYGQVEFRHIHAKEDMDKVWSDAASTNKPVFVDIYATWCGPCKWMDANVFASEIAGKYMNTEFINVKMDGESEYGRQFAMEAGLTAYPSFFLYDAEQTLMNKFMGAKPWEEFQPVLTSTLEYYPVMELLQRKFESNLLEKEEYSKLVSVLREMGKEEYGNTVAGTYRKKYTDEGAFSAEDISVIAFYTDPGTKVWEKMMTDISLVREALGEDLELFIEQSLTSSIELAAEDIDKGIVDDYTDKLPALTKNTSLDHSELTARANVYFYHYTEQFEELIAYIDEGYSKRMGDHEWLFEAASDAVFLDPRNAQMAAQGLKWFETCIEEEPVPDYYYSLAITQYYSGEEEKSIPSLEKAKELSSDPEFITNVNQTIQQVKDALAN
ncbi:MAG TPA: thioredoxin family protein [Bacteroidales bacterium]|nr:thioredoxin family protein [Bacteroidales bacterium]